MTADGGATSVTRRGRVDLDALAALEEERDFLLRSLDDLDAERAAGDIDEGDYRTLQDDYTARAAVVIEAIEAGHVELRTSVGGPRSLGRRVLGIAAVVVVAIVAGVAVAQSSGRRGSGEVTGLDVTAASARVDDCIALETSDGPEAAVDCFTEILDALPANVAALTFRGWVQVRELDADAGLADLDAAIQLDPEATSPYVFRASARSRLGDPFGAIADLATFVTNDPAPEEAVLVDTLGAGIVADALGSCIQADVSGAREPVEVLACYRDVLTVDPANAPAHVYLGWLLARSGVDDDAALAQLDAGLDADPELSAGYVFRAAFRAHLGDVDGARTDLETFDGLGAPPDEVAAAAQVRAALDAGRDPMP